jgi:phosphoribosylaminoimidazole (AIR) synthetase
MGIGMVVILEKRYVRSAQKILQGFKLKAGPIGLVVKGKEVEVV